MKAALLRFLGTVAVIKNTEKVEVLAKIFDHEVRWVTYGEFGSGVPHVEVFASLDEATQFAMNLRQAMKLVKGAFYKSPSVENRKT